MANNVGASGHNLTKLAHVMCGKAGMKIWVQILGACTLNTNLRDFGQLWTSIANNSIAYCDIDKRKKPLSTTIFPTFVFFL